MQQVGRTLCSMLEHALRPTPRHLDKALHGDDFISAGSFWVTSTQVTQKLTEKLEPIEMTRFGPGRLC